MKLSDLELAIIIGALVLALYLWTADDLTFAPMVPALIPALPRSNPSHPDRSNIVAQAKADVLAQGIDITGPCGAASIVARACALLNAMGDGAGMLDKPSGNNCDGRAVDIICYQDGAHYDVLGDSGGANEPRWGYAGQIDPGRWRPV